MFDVDPLFTDVLSLRLSVPSFWMFTHAVTPLEKFTSLQVVLLAEAREKNPPNNQIRTKLDKSFFIDDMINE